VDYYSRYTRHKGSTARYGDLSRNSTRLDRVGVCVIKNEDLEDLAYLTEQIFVCLLQSYRSLLFATSRDTVNISDTENKYVVAMQCAKYFNEISMHVFRQTRWPGATSRMESGVAQGANFNSPLEEWTALEETLFIL
jgi:hypothetical protein